MPADASESLPRLAERASAGPVAVVDTDPQGSQADWWNQRTAETPLFATVDIARLPAHMTPLEGQRVNLAVIDIPPAFIDTIKAAIAVADLGLIPARPSPHDLGVVGVIVEMAKAFGTLFYFVVNDVTPRTTLAREAVRALAQHGRVALVTIHQPIDLTACMLNRRTVMIGKCVYATRG